MSAAKDYANEYIEIGQNGMPVSVALLALKYRYDGDVVAALYDYAYVHQDNYVFKQANAVFSRNRKRNTGGPVASPGNLPRTSGYAITKPTAFSSIVIDVQKLDAVVALLHQLMEGKTKPKDVLMPVRAAMEAGVIRRPTWEEFCQEFGSWRVKNKSSFSDYTNPDNKPYAGADFEMMKDKFRGLVTERQ